MTILYPHKTVLKWVLLALFLVVLPHTLRLPTWISALFIMLCMWRYSICHYQRHLPPTFIRVILSLMVFAGIFAHYHTLFGRDAGVALLVGLLGLKLLEMNHKRDAFLVICLCYFLVVTNFLYSQSILIACYMGAVTWVITSALMQLSNEQLHFPIMRQFRTTGVLLLQALPLMLLLFFLFPRLPGPFWSLPKDANSGQSGLSDTMSFDNIKQLALSDEIAFRVKFDGDIPPTQQRYWRGPVLWKTDGKKWSSAGQYRIITQQPPLKTSGKSYSYTVTLEPHQKQWLLALDMPKTLPAHAYMSPDYQLLSKREIRTRTRYKLISYPDYNASGLSSVQRRLSLRLPQGKHHKARLLARKWWEEFKTPEAIVNQALIHFNTQPFRYTLSPPPLFNDSVDEFLFTTQAGFCEHYASAFTVLMRAAGIPARVVTGYQGGELNPVGDYLVVRQRDAHAWAEVWIEGKGWLRIDPTGAVSPERVEQGINTALPNSINTFGFNMNPESTFVQSLRYITNRWDAVNNFWNQWILGYGPEQQKNLLHKLGFDSINLQKITQLFVISVLLMLGIIGAWILLHRQRIHDPVQRLYFTFCQRLAKTGIERLPSETPVHFAQRAVESLPHLSKQIQTITTLYTQLRYRGDKGTLRELKQAVQRFHI